MKKPIKQNEPQNRMVSADQVTVRARQPLAEVNGRYKKGEVFQIDAARAEALGDTVEVVSNIQPEEPSNAAAPEQQK